MSNHLAEVGTKFVEIDVASLLYVHQGKTKLILLVFVAIAKHIHDACELVASQFTIFILVKDVKYSVCKEGVLALAKQPHLLSELLNIHH